MNEVPNPGADGVVTLRFLAEGARQVSVAGDFNGWDASALPMEDVGGGWWEARTPPLLSALHTPVQVCYKFVVNGERWAVDPLNPLRVRGDSAIHVPAAQPFTPAARGRVVTGAVYFSSSLGRPCRYLAYLPAAYSRHVGQRFPVLYLLHGHKGGGATDWLLKGNLAEILDILMDLGRMPPTLVVLPEAGDGLYADRLGGGWPLERALTHDLVRHVDSTLRTRANRRGRAIGGVSAGGYGAVKLALQYPHLFCSAHAHSGFFDVRDDATFPDILGTGPGATLHRRWNSPIELVREPPRTEAIRLGFDCGEQDPLLEESLAFQQEATDRGVPHGFWITPGHHTWDVWQRMLPLSLESHGAAFQGRLRGDADAGAS